MDKTILPFYLSSTGSPKPDAGTAPMLDDALALASVGVAALKTLEDVLPAAARNVEEASKILSGHFRHMAQQIKAQDILMEQILAVLRKNEVPTEALCDEILMQRQAIADSLMKIIVTMQFQDRNTQITENAARVLGQYGGMLADIRDRLSQAHKNVAAVDASAALAAETLLAGICIGDVRTQFIQALMDVNLQYDLGQAISSGAANEDGEVELF